MTIPATDVTAVPPQRRRSRVIDGLVITVVAAVVVAIGFVIVSVVIDRSWQRTEFESLAEHPDSSLQGTIAYLADESQCVRIAAAAGQPAKDVLCLESQDVAKATKLGKLIGPQLVWLPDGRLEVTMFRMTDPPGPTFRAGWQEIVDVRTGVVEDVPAADVPSEANLGTHPTVSPSGEQVSTTVDGRQSEVILNDGTRSRTLVSVQLAPQGGYGVEAVFWAPNWQWIAADDGRILIVTPDDPSVTRVLTNDSTMNTSGLDPSLARFAVTDANILTTAS